MKEYNKEKLHEYAKELFALCLEKNVEYIDITFVDEIGVLLKGKYIRTFIGEYNFKCNSVDNKNLILPIWKLIEKVKQL